MLSSDSKKPQRGGRDLTALSGGGDCALRPDAPLRVQPEITTHHRVVYAFAALALSFAGATYVLNKIDAPTPPQPELKPLVVTSGLSSYKP